MPTMLLVCLLVLGVAQAAPQAEDRAFELAFPEGFIFSSATASYQVEGAWNESGKGENLWDRTTHEHPELVLDGSNGDVACDSYHKYKEDIQLVKSLGTGMYRFSLSWSRLLPTGAVDQVNQDGVDYYNKLINESIKNGIEPMVTLFHWDLPQPLQDLGGFPNELIADYFVDYAEFAFQQFGDRVKWWVTLNEPWTMCVEGYGNGGKAPHIISEARGDYLCAHTMLKAHGRAYRLYQDQFKHQNGKIGIAANSDFFYPKDPYNAKDVAAAQRWQQFNLGWFTHPIFSSVGDYPSVMREYINKASKSQGLKRSRLPYFNQTEINMIKGSADFFGMNVYTSTLVANDPVGSSGKMTRQNDGAVKTSYDPSWESTIAPWHYVVPEGFRKILNWIKKEYNNPEVIITENGYPDNGLMKDVGRVNYYRLYLLELLKAIHEDKCNVIGYTAWSLMDNYEWFFGYMHRFGLHHVDFTDPARPRTPKMSAKFFQKLISTRRVPREGEIDFPDDPVTTTSTSAATSSAAPTTAPSEAPSAAPTTAPTAAPSAAPASCCSALLASLCAALVMLRMC